MKVDGVATAELIRKGEMSELTFWNRDEKRMHDEIDLEVAKMEGMLSETIASVLLMKSDSFQALKESAGLAEAVRVEVPSVDQHQLSEEYVQECVAPLEKEIASLVDVYYTTKDEAFGEFLNDNVEQNE